MHEEVVRLKVLLGELDPQQQLFDGHHLQLRANQGQEGVLGGCVGG